MSIKRITTDENSPVLILETIYDATPTTDEPDMDTIEDWLFDGETPEATDGCNVEPDGHCPHGHPSWLIVLGYI